MKLSFVLLSLFPLLSFSNLVGIEESPLAEEASLEDPHAMVIESMVEELDNFDDTPVAAFEEVKEKNGKRRIQIGKGEVAARRFRNNGVRYNRYNGVNRFDNRVNRFNNRVNRFDTRYYDDFGGGVNRFNVYYDDFYRGGVRTRARVRNRGGVGAFTAYGDLLFHPGGNRLRNHQAAVHNGRANGLRYNGLGVRNNRFYNGVGVRGRNRARVRANVRYNRYCNDIFC